MPKVFCVLCECKNAGNMGAAARAIKNMGLDGLILVRPNLEQLLEGIKMAPGALDILEGAVVSNSLKEAVSDMHLVIGTTRRIRGYRSTIFTPRQVCAQIIDLPLKSKVAIVFGSERNGLSNYELSFCQRVVVIPSSPKLPSINLAQAVMIMAYEWQMICRAEDAPASYKAADMECTSPGRGGIRRDRLKDIPKQDQRQLLIEHIERFLKRISFLKDNHKNIRLTLIDMLSRLDPNERQIAILRGILSKTEKALDGKEGKWG